jgi:hypothetical protein
MSKTTNERNHDVLRIYEIVHDGTLPIYKYNPSSQNEMLKNFPSFSGLIFIFEKDEEIELADKKVSRLVFVGFSENVRTRVRQYVRDIKRNATLKRHVGYAMLNQDGYDDKILRLWWNYKNKERRNNEEYKQIEDEYVLKVLAHIQMNMTFMPVRMDDVMNLEPFARKILATLSWGNFGSSRKWLGNKSPHWQVRESGLWAMRTQKNDMVMQEEDFKLLEKLIEEMN